jgi:hypothetical protein
MLKNQQAGQFIFRSNLSAWFATLAKILLLGREPSLKAEGASVVIN